MYTKPSKNLSQETVVYYKGKINRSTVMLEFDQSDSNKFAAPQT